MAATEMSSASKAPFDCSSMVQARVQRACQAPFYSQFREEVTRQACSVYEAKARAQTQSSVLLPSVVDDAPTGTTFFPFANQRSADKSQALAAQAAECVTLIGGTGFFGKFVAEQYLNRGISVTVLTRDVEKARAIFVPIASGEREERVKASQGYVRLPGHTEAVSADAGAYADEQRKRKVLWYNYRSTESVSRGTAPAAGAAPSPLLTPVHRERNVTLEIVEGNMNSSEDVEFAVRRASVVYFLAPAQEAQQEPPRERKKWYKIQSYFGASSPSSSAGAGAAGATGSWGNYGGFLRAFDACRRVDAHFVSLTPLWVHGSRLSPVFWYRRLVTHPYGYVKAVRHQEHNLLEREGTPSRRCYFGTEGDADTLEKPAVWWYWWSILRSTKLPDDLEHTPRSPVRFSLFRLSDIVYPAFNTRMVAVKNNRIDSALHVHNIDTGDLDARLLANILAKTVALSNSVVESRIDVGGRLRGEVDMRDTAAVLEMFSRFRNED